MDHDQHGRKYFLGRNILIEENGNQEKIDCDVQIIGLLASKTIKRGTTHATISLNRSFQFWPLQN
jgi:hypothetical protein